MPERSEIPDPAGIPGASDQPGRDCIAVEVCYGASARAGQPGGQFLGKLSLPAGSTIHQAIRQSGLLELDAEIDLSRFKVGIHGKVRPLDTNLREGDRVEIYRPLLVDPMAARRRRAVVKSPAR